VGRRCRESNIKAVHGELLIFAERRQRRNLKLRPHALVGNHKGTLFHLLVGFMSRFAGTQISA
jgi:hypothetical protein